MKMTISSITRIRVLLMFTIIFVFCRTFLYSQDRTKIELINANSLEFNKNVNKDIRILKGSVAFKHNNTFLYCDSAYLYSEANSVDAFGKVHIRVNDTLNVYGDFLKYDGNTKIAEIDKNVKMTDRQFTMTTQHLTYNLNDDLAYYNCGGKIIDKKNILTSKIAYYYADKKELFFKDNVFLENPEYTVDTDTMRYHTVSKTSYFFGPTKINSNENNIYCENGWYDTKNDICQFNKKAKYSSKKQIMTADSLYYNRKIGLGKGIKKVTITDTVEKIIIKGEFAYYNEKEGYAIVNDSSLMIQIGETDSLYLHADTLKAIFDSTKKVKYLFAFHKAKFFKSDLQGMSDSIVYNFKDSLIMLYKKPVIWSDSNQLTATYIKLMTKNNSVQKMFLYKTSFIISKEDTLGFNQIKGIDMIGYFEDNKLVKIEVSGGSETVYYTKDENKKIIGVNKSESTDMIIFLKDKKVDRITFIKLPKAVLLPPKDARINDLVLKDFNWLIEKKPLCKYDIFKW